LIGDDLQFQSAAGCDASLASERVSDYLAKFVNLCRAEPSVEGVILLGSAASIGASDRLSDLDLIVVTSQRRRLSSREWLELIDPPPLFSWMYQSPIGGHTVRQSVYDGPLVVDIALVPRLQAFLLGLVVMGLSRFPALRRQLPASQVAQLDAWVAITGRGTRVLLDTHGLAKRMSISIAPEAPKVPTKEAYINTVHSLFGLLLWESKQLVRRELWMAVGTIDQQAKQCLLTMMEWHAIARDPKLGDTWYGGRRIREWADPRWLAALPQTWPSYDVDAAWDALLATLELFTNLARETAHSFGYPYPLDDELSLRSWMADRRPLALSDE
jgi:aminoglycoside 6-adenylyltransferase